MSKILSLSTKMCQLGLERWGRIKYVKCSGLGFRGASQPEICAVHHMFRVVLVDIKVSIGYVNWIATSRGCWTRRPREFIGHKEDRVKTLSRGSFTSMQLGSWKSECELSCCPLCATIIVAFDLDMRFR